MSKSGLSLFFIAWLSCACATTARQTENLSQLTRGIPESHLISQVPFINQSDNFCGPATLAMVMQFHGVQVTMNELGDKVFTPGKQGTFQTDMISAGRRHKMMAVKIEGIPALLTEVHNDHPVIVFENLAFDSFPRWHYAVVIGYNIPKKQIVLHTGDQEQKTWAMDRFERSWIPADYWGLVLLPPGKLARSAGELANASAAAALEQMGWFKEAEKSYGAVLEEWPSNQVALIGLANIEYREKNYSKAVQILEKAIELHPTVAALWHNKALAESAAGKRKHAKKSALQAIELAPNDKKAEFQRSLAALL